MKEQSSGAAVEQTCLGSEENVAKSRWSLRSLEVTEIVGLGQVCRFQARLIYLVGLVQAWALTSMMRPESSGVMGSSLGCGWLSKLWSPFGSPKYQVPYYTKDEKGP